MNRESVAKNIMDVLQKCFKDDNIEIQKTERLGGLTNKNFMVDTNLGCFVVRFPGYGTEEFINREDERISTLLANNLKIDSELLYFDSKSGIKIAKYIENADTMSKDKFRGNKKQLKNVAEVFRILHNSQVDTKVKFDVFKMVKEYENIIQKSNGQFWKDYSKIHYHVIRLKNQLDQKGVVLSPCHNDPLCENFILGKNKLYLTDWEYGGMNDPMWDLADFIIEAELDTLEEKNLVEYYCTIIPSEDVYRRININKVFVDFLWALWALMKYSLENEKEMIDWANERYERAIMNLNKLVKI